MRNNFLFLQALLLSPTFELALQTGSVVEKMGKYMIEKGMKVEYALRGEKGEKLPPTLPPIVGLSLFISCLLERSSISGCALYFCDKSLPKLAFWGFKFVSVKFEAKLLGFVRGKLGFPLPVWNQIWDSQSQLLKNIKGFFIKGFVQC